jgi:hypothetical protein
VKKTRHVRAVGATDFVTPGGRKSEYT